MGARSVVHLTAEEKGERRQLQRVKRLVDWKKVKGVAGAKRIGQLWEREAMAKEGEFRLGVVEGGKKVKDLCDFRDAVADNIPGERNVSNRSAEEMKSGGGSARDSTGERVDDVYLRRKRFATPNQGLLRVKVKPDIRSKTSKEVKDDLEVLAATNEGAIIEKKNEKE